MPLSLRRLTANWQLKILAFALAVLLWVVVSAEQVTSNWIWVPLEVQVTDPNYQLVRTDLPREVQVRFSGPGRDLLDLALRRPPLRLTINQVEGTSIERTLEPRMVQLPGQIAVNALDVRPATVQLELTRTEARSIPVQPRVSLPTGAGWVLVDSIQVTPSRVRISGLHDRVMSVMELFTEPVELTPADSVFTRTVALDSTGLRGLDFSTRTVQLSGRLDRIIERRLEGVSVDVGPGVAIEPTAVEVTLRGPARRVEALSPDFFRVVISIAEIPGRIPPGGALVPLRVDGLAPAIQALLEPAAVRLFPAETPPDTLSNGDHEQPLGEPADVMQEPERE